MSEPRPGTVHAVLDAYRADAAERATFIRQLEGENRRLLDINAIYLRSILNHQGAEWFAYFLGMLAGACLFGAAAAIDEGRLDAAVTWGSLAGLFIGLRVIWRLHVLRQGR